MGTPPKVKGRKQTSVKVKSRPFRLAYPPEAVKPKKTEWLETAVKLLGPFKHQTDADALAAGAEFVDGKTRFPISAEAARRLVTEIAQNFNTAVYFDAAAPRIKAIYSELSELFAATNNLIDVLGALNDVTLHELRTREDMALFFGENVISNMDIALTKELPVPANETSTLEPHSWQDRLTALSRHAEFTKRRLEYERERVGRSPADTGGQTNVFKVALGPPKWGLVIESLTIFDAFKPDEATGSGNGLFHHFVSEIFEVATGKESVEAAVDDWVKDLVPVYRQLKQVQAELRDIDARMSDFKTGHEIDTAAAQEQRLELKRRLDVLHAQEKLLSEKLWPHVRTKLRSQIA